MDALWDQKRTSSTERVAQTAKGAAKLAELKAEMGYQHDPVEAEAPPAQAEAAPETSAAPTPEEEQQAAAGGSTESAG